jgi:hypothetical protein
MCNKLLYCNGLMTEAPVAQLDRASVYGTEGWGSESLQAYSKTRFFSLFRKSREAKKKMTGRCEGRKPYGYHKDEEALIKRIKQLHRKPYV